MTNQEQKPLEPHEVIERNQRVLTAKTVDVRWNSSAQDAIVMAERVVELEEAIQCAVNSVDYGTYDEGEGLLRLCLKADIFSQVCPSTPSQWKRPTALNPADLGTPGEVE